VPLPKFPFDGVQIISSDDALSFKKHDVIEKNLKVG
jgi:hypothetical protein